MTPKEKAYELILKVEKQLIGKEKLFVADRY